MVFFGSMRGASLGVMRTPFYSVRDTGFAELCDFLNCGTLGDVCVFVGEGGGVFGVVQNLLAS